MRGSGTRLTDQQRMEILDIWAQDAKVKNVELAKRYGISEGAIRKLKTVKDRVRSRYALAADALRDGRRRGSFVRNEAFEREVYDWILKTRAEVGALSRPLTQAQVRKKAMEVAQKYESLRNFKASPGWYARFCARHKIDIHAGRIGKPEATQVTMELDAPLPDGVSIMSEDEAVEKDTITAPPASAYQVPPPEDGAIPNLTDPSTDAIKLDPEANPDFHDMKLEESRMKNETLKEDGSGQNDADEIFSLGL